MLQHKKKKEKLPFTRVHYHIIEDWEVEYKSKTDWTFNNKFRQ